MDLDLLGGYITAVLITLILILGIAIPCSISEERNIEKEIKLKEIEMQYSIVESEEK